MTDACPDFPTRGLSVDSFVTCTEKSEATSTGTNGRSKCWPSRTMEPSAAMERDLLKYI